MCAINRLSQDLNFCGFVFQNASFQSVANTSKMVWIVLLSTCLNLPLVCFQVFTLTHAQRVTRLYRQSLKLTNSWAIDRQIFLEEAAALRSAFDTNSSLAATSK
jgi:hypothetical protein